MLGLGALALLLEQLQGQAIVEALLPDSRPISRWHERTPPLAHWLWFASRGATSLGVGALAIRAWRTDERPRARVLIALGAMAVVCWLGTLVSGGAPLSDGLVASLPSDTELGAQAALIGSALRRFEPQARLALSLNGGFPLLLLLAGAGLWRLERWEPSGLPWWVALLSVVLGLVQLLGYLQLADAEAALSHALWGVRWLWTPRALRAVLIWSGSAVVALGMCPLMVGLWLERRPPTST